MRREDFLSFINGGLMTGERVDILSGVHGSIDGMTTPDAVILAEDLAAFGDIPGVTIHNFPDLTSSQITEMLRGPGTTIGAFCNIAVCLAFM